MAQYFLCFRIHFVYGDFLPGDAEVMEQGIGSVYGLVLKLLRNTII